ncbi:formate/nitrite transporter family protein [Leisingera aquaemixtae]|uniref:formate/nitrite transporter family protein n=1 Tax=Leisingera aquaemixtae TaxID=1396826 RepID=UPI00288307AF|nr:formate/nitrite transporter family protein [Leisingera aquaemixtae]
MGQSSYAGNLAGAAGLAAAFAFTGLLDGPAGATAARIAEAKSALSPVEAFLRGALCNGLVCLAVWLSSRPARRRARSLRCFWPITAFVLLGLEHSVANMFFFPQGWAAGADVSLHAAAANLFWVTLGNIAGGAGGVAFAYWFAYLGCTAPAAGKAQRKR